TADRVDEGDGAVGVHSTVEDDHRRTTVTSRFHCRGQRGGGRGRDDDGVAVSVGDEGLDVRDLLIVVVTGVGYPELTDDSFVLEHLDLLLHGGETGDPPGVTQGGVREAQGCFAFVLGELGGVHHLDGFDHLQPGFVRIALGSLLPLCELLLVLFPDEELALGCAAFGSGGGGLSSGALGGVWFLDGFGRCVRGAGDQDDAEAEYPSSEAELALHLYPPWYR